MSLVVPDPPEHLRLRLATPLCLNTNGPLANDVDDLVMSLVNRLSDLARWQGVPIDTDWGGWRELSKRVEVSWIEVKGNPPMRKRSSAQPGRTQTYHGILGTFELSGPVGPLMPLLALGENAHAGARTAFGFGAYDLICW